MKQSPSQYSNGMTLLEILVVIGILILVSGFVASIATDTFRFNRKISSSLTSVDRAQRLLQPMAAEIRSATISALGSFPVAQASAYDLAFYSDIDNDGRPDYVHYYLSGTTLFKEVIHPRTSLPPLYVASDAVTVPFIEGVQNQAQGIPVFHYFSNQYTEQGLTELVNPDVSIESVRMIRVALSLATEATSTGFSIESDVTIRNLKQQ